MFLGVNAKVRIDREAGQRLIQQLKARRIKAWSFRHGVIVRLPIDDQTPMYRIPNEINGNSAEVLSLAEAGGAFSEDNGAASVICGPGGKKLRPYFVGTKPKEARSAQAMFSVWSVAFDVEAYFHGKVWLRRVELIEHRPLVEVKLDTLWEGYGQPPKRLSDFSPAIGAALAKARCRDCTHIHYANLSPRNPR